MSREFAGKKWPITFIAQMGGRWMDVMINIILTFFFNFHICQPICELTNRCKDFFMGLNIGFEVRDGRAPFLKFPELVEISNILFQTLTFICRGKPLFLIPKSILTVPNSCYIRSRTKIKTVKNVNRNPAKSLHQRVLKWRFVTPDRWTDVLVG